MNQVFQLSDSKKQEGERYLRFPLNSEVSGLVPLGDLQGVINVVLKDILPVPEVGEYLLGITNWQGEGIWILDLAGFLGAIHWCKRQIIANSGTAILIRSQGQTIGLLVEKVSTIETYDPKECLAIATSMLPERFHSFLTGYFIDFQGNPLVVLNISTAIQAIQS